MKFWIFLLIVPFVSAGIVVNEIMYNPSSEQGDDAHMEWVEVYTEEEINLVEYYFYDLQLPNQSVNNYFVIVRNTSSFLDYYKKNITTIESKFILSNKGGYINFTNLKNEYLVYYDSSRANGNGKTFESKDNKFYESIELGGTPGQENSITEIKEYNIKISEFLADPQDGSEWVEIYSDEEADLTGYYFSDSSNRTLFITDISGGTKLKANSYLMVDFQNTKLLNNDGDIIKLVNPLDVITDKISYGSSKKGFSWSKVDEKWILSEPSPGEENYKEQVVSESSIILSKPNSTKFGEILNVEISIYKGDTEKKSIYVYIENVSKRTKINLGDKFRNYNLNIPILIDPNCDYSLNKGKYFLIAEGLDTKDKVVVELNGINTKMCAINSTAQDCQICNCIDTETNLNEENEIYQSKGIKAERAAILFFCMLLVLIIMIQFKNGR